MSFHFIVVVVVVVGFVLLSRGFPLSLFSIILDSGYDQLGVAVFRA